MQELPFLAIARVGNGCLTSGTRRVAHWKEEKLGPAELPRYSSRETLYHKARACRKNKNLLSPKMVAVPSNQPGVPIAPGASNQSRFQSRMDGRRQRGANPIQHYSPEQNISTAPRRNTIVTGKPHGSQIAELVPTISSVSYIAVFCVRRCETHVPNQHGPAALVNQSACSPL